MQIKQLWQDSYLKAKSNGFNPLVAGRYANKVVSSRCKTANVKMSDNVKLNMTVIKSGWFSRDYVFNIELTNNLWDSDNERASELLIDKLVKSNKISKIGDVDHERYFKQVNKLDIRRHYNADEGTDGLYRLHSYNYDNGKLIATVSMNKDHKLFNKYLNLHKSGKYLYASAEFKNCQMIDGVIVDAEQLDWTITDNPVNKNLAPMSAI